MKEQGEWDWAEGEERKIAISVFVYMCGEMVGGVCDWDGLVYLEMDSYIAVISNIMVSQAHRWIIITSKCQSK